MHISLMGALFKICWMAGLIIIIAAFGAVFGVMFLYFGMVVASLLWGLLSEYPRVGSVAVIAAIAFEWTRDVSFLIFIAVALVAVAITFFLVWLFLSQNGKPNSDQVTDRVFNLVAPIGGIAGAIVSGCAVAFLIVPDLGRELAEEPKFNDLPFIVVSGIGAAALLLSYVLLARQLIDKIRELAAEEQA